MQQVIVVGQFILAHYQEILAAVMAILSGVIAISLMIPGDQPEKALQGVVDFLAKFSRKPAE
jgi:hypothetical protein